MAWRSYIFDTLTGRIDMEINLPSFSWTLTVSDSSLSTTQDKGVGTENMTGLTVPWTAVPSTTPEGRETALASYRRSIILEWEGNPVVAGIIGPRTDSWLDTSFDLISPMSFMENRYLVKEGYFGTGSGSTTRMDYKFSNLSLRAIATAIVRECIDFKQGGTMPVLYPYYNEAGSHERTYYGYNVANASVKTLLDNLSNVENGPDLQFRPYLKNENYIGYTFLGGDPYLTDDDSIPSLSCYPGGGTLQDISVAWLGPTQRVFATGDGQDYAMLCHQSEDMTLCTRTDPYPLVETTASGSSDWNTEDLVKTHGDAIVAAMKDPICQIKGNINANDCPVQPGVLWPGQNVELMLEGYPTLPDDVYSLRLMEMSGNNTADISLIFEPVISPWER